MSEVAYIFLDANTALHFKRPDFIDWRDLTGCERVVLVGAPILHRELEQQKIHNPSRKLRERAATYIKWLVQFVRDPTLEVRAGTVWHFIPIEPGIDFHANNLSMGIADDHLIASVISYVPTPDAQVYVATADVGMEIKLRHRQIMPLLLPDTARLPDELDPQEKELLELRRQVARRHAPNLALITKMDGSRHPMHVGAQLALSRALPLEEMRRQNPILGKPDSSPPGKNSHQALQAFAQIDIARIRGAWLTPERIERYNEERESFLADYQRYLDALAEYEEQAALTIELQLELTNTGTAPGSDIDVILNFPHDLILMDQDKLPRKPKEPEPPLHPDRLVDFAGMSSSGGYKLGNLFPHSYPEFPVVNFTSSVRVHPDRSQIRYWLKTLKHGFTEKLDVAHLRFPDRRAVRQFHVEYEISSAELPEATIGRLHFVLS